MLQGRSIRLAVMGLAAIVAPLVTGCGNDGAGATNTGVAGAGMGAAGAGGLAGTGTAGAPGSTGGGGVSSGGNSGAGGVVTLRIASFVVAPGTTSGRSLDIYDDMYMGGLQPSESGTPLIAGLAYGTISGYVKPRFVDFGGTAVALVALPAGSPPTDTTDAQLLWDGTDDGAHPQLTIALYSDLNSSGVPISFLGFEVYPEKGDDSLGGEKGPLAPAPPTGQGEYLVNTEAVDDFINASPGLGYFFLVDESCAAALNGINQLPGLPMVGAVGSSVPDVYFSQFTAAPGTHSISIVAWNNPTPTPACSDLLGSEQGTSSVNVAAGQQIITFVYGTSFTDLHLLAAPIAP